jgi:fatty-acyl-CoA synthase
MKEGEITLGWEIDWIDSRARLTPDACAVIDAAQNKSWTYGEINQRAVAAAVWLENKGVQKGDRIALLSPNHVAYLDLLFACAKIGAIFVPLNWRLSIEELNYILSDCSPALIGYHSQFHEILEKLDAGDEKIFCCDDSQFANVLKQKANLEKPPPLSESDALAIIYTGGTTGNPKGAVLAHRTIMANAINTVISWNLTDKDVTLTSMPMFHTGGLNALSIPLLLIGGKLVITDSFGPAKSIEYINRFGCTTVLFVPTMYHMIFQTEEFKDSNFPTMKTFLSGGAPCPLEIYEVFKRKGIAFKEGYGLTEAGPNNFYIDPTMANEKRGSVGTPMMFNAIKIVDDDGREVKANEVGELLISGKHVFERYWNNEEATREAIRDGWLHTGDLVKRDEQGFHYIVGRKKDMIITGGENVYPLEVEHWLTEHPVIQEAAVIGLPDEKWGESVTAFIVSDYVIIPTELKAYCARKLGGYKIPRQFFFVEELPKTHVGKIDKKRLKEMGLEFLKLQQIN